MECQRQIKRVAPLKCRIRKIGRILHLKAQSQIGLERKHDLPFYPVDLEIQEKNWNEESNTTVKKCFCLENRKEYCTWKLKQRN